MSFLPASVTFASYAAMGMLIFAGACLQGIGGVGFAMLAAPVSVFFFPELVPGPLLAMGGAVSLLTAIRERHEIAWQVAGTALVGRALGAVLAVQVIAWMAPPHFALVFGISILAAVALSLLGWRVRPSIRNMALAGTASGLMGTITSAGAPPVVIAMQHMPPPAMRATMGCILSGGALLSVALLALAGRFGAHELALSVMLVPCLLAGFVLSGRIKGRVSPAAVRRLLLTLCTVAALGVLARAAVQL